jgi:hypothetical protein
LQKSLQTFASQMQSLQKALREITEKVEEDRKPSGRRSAR